MVAEALVREPLTPEMIIAGGSLGRTLNERLLLVACFWYYLPEPNAWRLHLATPLFLTDGPLQLYRRIQKALQESKQEKQGKHGDALDLLDTTVIADRHPLVASIRAAMYNDPEVAPDFHTKGYMAFEHGQRLRSRVLDGHYLEEAYVYLILPPLSGGLREYEFNVGPAPVINGVGELAKRSKGKK
jgi:hypothetical protein